MQRPRSSQPQPSHHHTSEHSNSWTITARDSHHSLGQTTHCQKPGLILRPAHAEQKTSTRIQTHQNLFTLTKNISAPQQNQAGSKHPVFQFPTFAGTATKKPKLDFPCTNQPPPQPVIASEAKQSILAASIHQNAIWWRWTESNRRPPACKAGALPIELHPQSTVFRPVGWVSAAGA